MQGTKLKSFCASRLSLKLGIMQSPTLRLTTCPMVEAEGISPIAKGIISDSGLSMTPILHWILA